MPADLHHLWVYLAASPLLWLTVTVSVYVVGDGLYQRLGRNPLANPVVFAIVALVLILELGHIPYHRYFEGAQFVHFLLGPATVALAVPLYEHLSELRRHWRPILLCVVIGSATASGSAMVVGALLGASHLTVLSLAPKSVTTPIAMGISEKIGGEPALTAVMVVITGIFGAMAARPVLRLFGVTDPRARGLAMGAAAHGIGTATAFQEDHRMGAYAGLAMALCGVCTALLLPFTLRVLGIIPG